MFTLPTIKEKGKVRLNKSNYALVTNIVAHIRSSNIDSGHHALHITSVTEKGRYLTAKT
jgi:hypothetical protein